MERTISGMFNLRFWRSKERG